MLGNTVLSKLLSIGGQVVLAWYLVRDDMGLVALALSVASFPSLLRDAGLQQILVQRQSNFRRWASPVFWMSLTLGIASGVLLAAIGPVAARVLSQPSLVGLVTTLSVGTLLSALGTVPAAKIQIDLRYRLQAALAMGIAVATTFLNVLMARMHFGAYSIIMPLVMVTGLRTIVLWIVSPVSIRWQLHIRRWRYLSGDSGTILATAAFMMLVSNGDYLILGYLCGADVVGIFYFAFNLSVQTLALMTVNFGTVLFPALSRLQTEPHRQIEAYLAASRVFAAIAVPFCLLQAAASDAGCRLIFKPIWFPSIPVLQILSIAMGIRVVAIPAQALTAAQNRLRFGLVISVIYSTLFLATVAAAAQLGGSNAASFVAGGELLFFATTEPLYMYLLLKMNHRGVADVVRVYAVPLIAGGCAASAASAAGHFFFNAEGRLWQLPRLAVVVSVMALVYIPLVRLLSVELWEEVLARLKPLLSRTASTP